jgi:hypothetical protein
VQQILSERDQELEKSNQINLTLRTESNKMIAQLRQQMTAAVRRVEQLQLQN